LYPLDFSTFFNRFDLEYGSSYKYEIKLNGKNICFSYDKLKYSISNDTITFSGCLNKNDKINIEELIPSYFEIK